MGSNRDPTTIRHTSAAGSTIGFSHGFGGFLGNSDWWIQIEDSSFTGHVESRYDVGGFFGYKHNHDANFHRCVSSGTIHNRGAYDRIGGLVGRAQYNSRFYNCNSSANVTGRWRVGGITGFHNRTRFENCRSSANVRATSGEAGGIAGFNVQTCIVGFLEFTGSANNGNGNGGTAMFGRTHSGSNCNNV